MRTKMRNCLGPPDEIREEYWQETLTKNSFSLRVICVIIFGVELYNIARVLFLSPSGLSTRNNQIYFGLYCALLVLAALWLVLQRIFARAPWQVRWGVQYGMVILSTFWHVCLNAYDLRTGPYGDITVYITAILALGAFIRMPAVYSLVCVGTGYGLFLAAAAPALSGGYMVNLTIATIVALGMSCTNHRHAVTELRQRKALWELAYMDPLTGLLNTGSLKRWAERYLDAAETTGGVTLFIIDIDNFKVINDTYGHPAGDEVLKKMAIQMRQVFQEAGQLGRIGGDEFAVVLPDPMDEASAEGLGEQLIQKASEIQLESGLAGVRCSVGICRSDRPGADYSQLYQKADQALYQAKRAGKERCCIQTLSPGEAGTAP